MIIPLIISNISLEQNFQYFSIGRFKYQLYLLVKINITELVNNYENLINIALYISNNNSNSYHLYCFGLFRDVSFGNFYLVYEYPIYSLRSFFSTKRTEHEKTTIYFHFEQYYSTFNKKQNILLYGDEFIFINKYVYLKCLNLPFKIINRSRKIYQCLFPNFESLSKNITKKVFVNSHSRNCFVELLKQMKTFIDNIQDTSNISPIIYTIVFDDEKEQNHINYKAIQTNNNDNNYDIVMKAEYNEEYNDLEIRIISVNKMMNILSTDLINPFIPLIPLQYKTYTFMLKHFPINPYSRFLNVYYTETNKYTRTDCLRNKDIPKIKEESEIIEKINIHNNCISIIEPNKMIKHKDNKEMYNFRKVYDVNKVKDLQQLQDWLDEAKIIWMNGEGKKYPFKEDLALMFLDICNYDMEKALKYIQKSSKIFMKFIKIEFDISHLQE
jgi:hypothetical protein